MVLGIKNMHKFKISFTENIVISSFGLSICTFFSVLLIGTSILRLTNFVEFPKFIEGAITQSWEVRLFIPVVISPLWETLILQLIPIFLLQKVTRNIFLVLAACTTFFSVAHISNSTLNAIQTIIPGLTFSFAFIYWQQKTNSYRKGFEASLIVHSLHNFYQFLLSFLPASLLF